MKLNAIITGVSICIASATAAAQSSPPSIAQTSIEPRLNAKVPALPKYNKHNATESVLSLHKALVNIPSVSGNEDDIAHWLKKYLEKLSFHVYLQELPSEDSSKARSKRYNVLASRNRSLKTPVLLTTHIDTVPPFTSFKRTIENGKAVLHGRGSNDAKASVAAQVVALVDLIQQKKISHDTASLLFVVDEEVHGRGMRAANTLNKDNHWKAVIFGEPTESRLIKGHKGIALFDVIAHGRDAHSGYPWLGESAVDMLIPALVALRAAELKLPSSEEVGNSTLNIGMITGGVAGNVVAAHAKAQIAIRIGGGTIGEIHELISRTVQEVNPRLELQWSGNGYGPVKCDTDIDGFELGTVNYGTDVPNLTGAHKRYLFGPGSILSAHSDHESIDEEELVAAVPAYQKLIIGALKGLEADDTAAKVDM